MCSEKYFIIIIWPAGKVLSVLAWAGLQDLRLCEGGNGRCHSAGGLHDPEVLFTACELLPLKHYSISHEMLFISYLCFVCYCRINRAISKLTMCFRKGLCWHLGIVWFYSTLLMATGLRDWLLSCISPVGLILVFHCHLLACSSFSRKLRVSTRPMLDPS